MREKRKREIERNREKWLKLIEVVLNETIKFELNIISKKYFALIRKRSMKRLRRIQNRKKGV